MRKIVLCFIASAVLLGAAMPVASTAAQKRGVAYSARLHHQGTRHRDTISNLDRAHNDITSFSSSSVLHVGVNHPPGK